MPMSKRPLWSGRTAEALADTSESAGAQLACRLLEQQVFVRPIVGRGRMWLEVIEDGSRIERGPRSRGYQPRTIHA